MPILPVLAAIPRHSLHEYRGGGGLCSRAVNWIETLKPYLNSMFLERDQCRIYVTYLTEASVITSNDTDLFAIDEARISR